MGMKCSFWPPEQAWKTRSAAPDLLFDDPQATSGLHGRIWLLVKGFALLSTQDTVLRIVSTSP
jgi:hypothetical protein